MATEKAQQSNDKAGKGNGNPDTKRSGQPRVISHPGDVAGLVMMRIDNVNTKKDDLTIAIKGLADTAKQLVRAYAQNTQAIKKLQMRVQALEKEKQK